MIRNAAHTGFAVSGAIGVTTGIAVLAGVVLSTTNASSKSHSTALPQATQPDTAQPDRPAQPDKLGTPDMGRALIEGLKASPGCLGVDAGEMMSGKNTIFAWFENKEAVEEWYYSRAHMGMIKSLIDPAAAVDHEPLAHVEDDKTPIMVIATLTFAERPSFETLKLPVSQISIELFKPLPGGAYLGGRLAPDKFEVPHMEDLAAEGG